MRSADFIERRIVGGLVISTEYTRRLAKGWRDDWLDTPELARIARWCIDYFNDYGEAPLVHIEDIYMDHMTTDQLDKAEAEMIEATLRRISDDYDRAEQFNVDYLYDRTVDYFRQREQRRFAEEVEQLTDRGQVQEADALITSYKPSSFVTTLGLEVGSEEGYAAIEHAFATTSQPVVQYPGAFGKMVNPHLIRGGFVAFLAPEKRGKTWLMTDVAIRALRQKANVAFFQAGDLTQDQMLRRVCIYLSHRSDDPQYCGEYYRPVGDCIKNQFDDCNRRDRNCSFGVYDDGKKAFYDEPKAYENFDNLVKVVERNPEYAPCDSATCHVRRGTVWLVKEAEREPLSVGLAVKTARGFFDRYKRRFKLATVASSTLSCADIKRYLTEWEYQDGFVPDLIIVDYADLMTAPEVSEYRHKQNAIWQGLRGISQEWHALMLTATQADAASYKQDSLGLSNFSEDKRKYAHVTAMWGLNQSRDGREKKLGIMRINELVVREGIYNVDRDVVILQDLRSGRPFLESYDYVNIS